MGLLFSRICRLASGIWTGRLCGQLLTVSHCPRLDVYRSFVNVKIDFTMYAKAVFDTIGDLLGCYTGHERKVGSRGETDHRPFVREGFTIYAVHHTKNTLGTVFTTFNPAWYDVRTDLERPCRIPATMKPPCQKFIVVQKRLVHRAAVHGQVSQWSPATLANGPLKFIVAAGIFYAPTVSLYLGTSETRSFYVNSFV